MLAALYTDSSAYSVAGTIARGLGRLRLETPRLKALASRMPRGVPRGKVFSSDLPIRSALSRGILPSGLGSTYQRWGLQGADAVYSMNGEDTSFLEWAKAQGAKIMVDVFVHPGTSRIVAEESLRFMEDGPADQSAVESVDAHNRRAFKVADILLCPSNWVAEGVRGFLPDCAGKIRVVPYGSSIAPVDRVNAPTPGRVFFAGREALRKGVHYLAEAALLARKSNPQVEVCVAGLDRCDIDWVEHKDELTCLGTIPMHQMHLEFSRADVFVLPSLSEGQAGVVLEAMACGCPVIATRESGVDFEPGCGITVPARNAAALAEAILEVVGNRDKRIQLAEGALRQSREYAMDAWTRRLVEVVEAARPFNKEDGSQ